MSSTTLLFNDFIPVSEDQIRHEELANLEADDHPQYLTEGRGDVRYELVDATILREADLTGDGVATTPARSDHRHDADYDELGAADAERTEHETLYSHDIYDAHVSNTQNPHSVTAAQAGADPAGTAASELDGHETSFDHLAYDSHVANLSNPHGVTPGQIGAEPVDATLLRTSNLAGTGSANTPARSDHSHNIFLNLDNSGAAITLDSIDLNTIDRTGFYYVRSTCSSKPGAFEGYLVHIRITNADFMIQRIHRIDSDETWVRRKVSGVWSAWGEVDATVEGHVADTSNPHNVTSEQIGAEPADATILKQEDLTGSGAALTPARSDHEHDNYVELKNTGEVLDLQSVDLNTVSQSGFYRANAECLNQPVAGQGYLTHLQHTSDYAIQRYTSLFDVGESYVRIKQSGTWGDWVADSGDGGGGSGSATRQCILSGKIDQTTGQHAHLEVVSNNVELRASQTPLVITFAEGYDSNGPVDHYEYISFDEVLSLSLVPDTRNYIYAQRESSGLISFGATPWPCLYSKKKGQVPPELLTITVSSQNTNSWGSGSVFYENEAYWLSTGEVANYIMWEYPGVVSDVSKLTFRTVNDADVDQSDAARLQGWDGTSFYTIYEHGSGVASDTEYTWTFSPTSEYKLFRLYFGGGAGNRMGIQYLKLLDSQDQIIWEGDWFDLSSFTMKQGFNGSVVNRVYLGWVDVDSGGVITEAYSYAFGDYVEDVFKATVSSSYYRNNPFGTKTIQKDVDIYIPEVASWCAAQKAFYTSQYHGIGVNTYDHDGIYIKSQAGSLAHSTIHGITTNVTSALARLKIRRAF